MDNREIAEKLKEALRLRYEPVAVTLVREGEEPPDGYKIPDKQMSHCQSVMAAARGEKFLLPSDMHSCKNGASALGMTEVPAKTASGDFYHSAGMFKNPEAAKRMVDQRSTVPFKVTHTAVGPLKDADRKPDVVIIEDIPERIYWVIPMALYHEGGRVDFNTAPYNACCVDVVARPLTTGRINISLGCFGCRKRTELRPEEMLVGIPFDEIPRMMDALENLSTGIMTKAVRD
ncbi:MAG TPA: DUF169 domain-containing protein [Candidatus Methanomethylophilaceae archaeon]|nr:DUF169 domain-containing protein [Candidatus Methanomethylophilaceae archaeon]